MKIRIETYQQGPTEIRVKRNPRPERPPSAAMPGEVPVANRTVGPSASPGITPIEGFKTLGQAAFGALAAINKNRKITGENNG